MLARRPWPLRALLLVIAFGALFIALAFIFMALPQTVKTKLVAPRFQPQTAEYVALGDSYTAAPQLEKQLAVSTPLSCTQSSSNYPHLTAAAIDPASFTDVSCGGAVTLNVKNPQWTPGGTNAAQGDALSPETKLVTVGLGGNDADILTLFFSCAGTSTKQSNCREKFESDGVDRFSQEVQTTRPLIEAMLAQISKRAPNAKIFVVGYPQVTPSDGSSCPGEMPFTGSDLKYFDEALRELNAELKSAAAEQSAAYVDTYSPSIGRNVCSGVKKRWIESVKPVAPAYSVHPNYKGEEGMAGAVIAAIGQSKP